MRPSPASADAPFDRLAIAVATGLGTGYGPIAPGTWGSIPGLALVWGLARLAGSWAVLSGTAFVVVLGLWAAGRAEALFGEKDPGRVVIDEIAGQMVALLFIRPTALVLLAAFFLFRVMDVLKPWPARRLEDLPGGSGIMADDLMAGLYANLILHGLALWRPDWLGLA